MRIRIFALTFLLALSVLVSGLGYVQLGMHERYRTMSEENRLKILPLMAPRGTIFDRNGDPLVKDVISFNAAVIYSRVEDKDALIRMLSSALEVPRDKVEAGVKKSRRQPYSTTVIVPDIGVENAIYLEEISLDHPGLLLEVSGKREYINGTTAANLIGYLGYINRTEFERLKHYGYRMDDLVGRDGVEKYYDDYLRGKHGGKQIEVDHRGREVVTLGYREPVPGKDVYLTIDLRLQEYCDSLLEGKQGAIIAMDPVNGEILALSSAPTYDPGIFIDRKRRREITSVLKSEEYPLLNRAITGAYPPGSVFKAVIAAAALDTGTVTPGTSFECQGSLTLGRRVFHCWRKDGHGVQDLREAIKNSCNVYFWRLGLMLGVRNIAEYSDKFGVGSVTGVDLPGEVPGTLPTPEWKRKHFRESWYKGETMNYSVGQGYLLMTPLQVARLMSAFANGGHLVQPHVVSLVGGVPIRSGERTALGIPGKSLDPVREGLRKVVNDRRGTGVKARLDDVVVAGKTGTAQTSKGKNHGWFAGFAPFKDPRLVVVIFDEYGGKGGYYAAGTAGKVFRRAQELGLLEIREQKIESRE